MITLPRDGTSGMVAFCDLITDVTCGSRKRTQARTGHISSRPHILTKFRHPVNTMNVVSGGPHFVAQSVLVSAGRYLRNSPSTSWSRSWTCRVLTHGAMSVPPYSQPYDLTKLCSPQSRLALTATTFLDWSSACNPWKHGPRPALAWEQACQKTRAESFAPTNVWSACITSHWQNLISDSNV